MSEIVAPIAEQGHLGQKTDAGLYTCNRGDYTAHDRAESAAIQKIKALSPRKIDRTGVVDRLVLRMVNEASWAMDE